MRLPVFCLALLTASTSLVHPATATAQQFVDGLAQPVFNVSGSNLITQQVWVEVPNLDLDRDGFNDRVRVQVRRPAVTEDGVKLPVVLVASPYSGGTRPYHTYYDINFELQPHDYIFQTGSRIGLMLLSSDRLFTLRPPPGAVLTLDTTKSTLSLPVVGGAAAFTAVQ